MPRATTPCCRFSTLSANHHDNEFLIGPGKALDPEKYFIIATDFLANARLRQDLTTGPTNSGLKMHFPRITARDWVNADYKLVKEYLGIDRVVAAVGALDRWHQRLSTRRDPSGFRVGDHTHWSERTNKPADPNCPSPY